EVLLRASSLAARDDAFHFPLLISVAVRLRDGWGTIVLQRARGECDTTVAVSLQLADVEGRVLRLQLRRQCARICVGIHHGGHSEWSHEAGAKLVVEVAELQSLGGQQHHVAHSEGGRATMSISVACLTLLCAEQVVTREA